MCAQIIREAGLRLNALSGIGGVQTHQAPAPASATIHFGLNALSGIGGVQTMRSPKPDLMPATCVLMPCRALEAFRRIDQREAAPGLWRFVLMPCRALEAFRLIVCDEILLRSSALS